MHRNVSPCCEPSLPLAVQVWKYPKVWEGFVKCCQRTKPQSFSVLLQLPPPQLTSVFERCPEMRDPLLQHVHSFTPHQVAPGGHLGSQTSLPRESFFWNMFDVNDTLVAMLQQAHIPASVMAVLEFNMKKPEPEPLEPVVEKEVMDQPSLARSYQTAILSSQWSYNLSSQRFFLTLVTSVLFYHT